jgi:hypothetical protein
MFPQWIHTSGFKAAMSVKAGWCGVGCGVGCGVIYRGEVWFDLGEER